MWSICGATAVGRGEGEYTHMNYRYQCLLWALVIITADQITKYFVSSKMFPGQSLPVLGNILHFTFLHNTGAAFSILHNQIWLLATLAIVASTALVIYYPRLVAYGNYMRFGSILLLGGTIGNLIDRLLYGSVIDFIDFRIWPVFNVADSAICSGAVLVAIALLRTKKSDSEAIDDRT